MSDEVRGNTLFTTICNYTLIKNGCQLKQKEGVQEGSKELRCAGLYAR